MNVKNAKNWSNVPRPQAYLVSIAITMAAFGIRYVLHPYFAPHVPYQMFLIACLLTGSLVGLGPALLSAALGLFLGTYFFIQPYEVLDGITRSDVVVAASYACGTLFSLGVIEYLQRAIYSNRLLLKVSQSRHKISLYRDNDRLYLAKKTSAAMRELQKLFLEFDRVLVFMPAGGALYPQPLLYRLCGKASNESCDDALQLFHPDDRAVLKNELSQAAPGDRHRELLLRLACGEAEHQLVRLALERVSFHGIHATVLKLVEDNGIAASTQPAASAQVASAL